MNRETIQSLAEELRHQRNVLFKEVVDTEADLEFIAQDRESELEERAQEDRAARLYDLLDVRAKHAIEEIDAALQRVADGRYGICGSCGATIAIKRLRVLPATRYCLDCARTQEAAVPGVAEATEVRHPGPLPADLGLLTDREIESALREAVREDGRVDLEELRMVSRHGVVYLDGAVPSEAEHQILFKIVTDVVGLREVVDRLQVKEILWERSDRFKPTLEEKKPSRLEPSQTEDVFKSTEEGIEYVPPDEPPPEEEK
jgi:RNA polymerase-binding transcription factor